MLINRLSLFVLPIVATLSLQANDLLLQDPFGDEVFKDMMQMQQNMDKMFNRMKQRRQQYSTHFVSPIGTYKISQADTFIDKKDHYEYITNIPENKENQIDINAKDGVMSIRAKIIEKQEKKTSNSFSSSSSMRMYQESIPLPSNADVGSIKAEYKNGKLVISVKKLKNVVNPQSNIRINGKVIQATKTENNNTKDNNSSKKTN